MTDEETKLPLVAKLSITVEGFSSVDAMTDSTGSFSVTLPESTKCTIVVSAIGFDSKEETVTISESSSNYVEIKLTPVVKVTLEGTIFGSESSELPLDATLKVYLNSDFVVEDSAMVVNGRYSESFTDFGWYIIDFSAPGYANARDTIWVMNSHQRNIHKDYHLVPLDSKLSIALTNIHFKFASTAPSPDAYVELNYLSDFLRHNLSKQIEIIGHTDNSGPAEYNLTLSRSRAEAIASYLMERGVKSDQIITVGYGGKKPIDSNVTAAGKANNRRVELVLSDKTASFESIANLRSIHFDFGTATLSPDSYLELSSLANFFIDNTFAHAEIAGHTDNTGSESYNIFLSQARAQAVVNYLKSKGVHNEQLLAKGYGATRPIDSNATATGKANNRRVELIVFNK